MSSIKLSAAAFEKARNFIKSSARRLEVARFNYHFEQGTADEILTALQPYQNPDGGFGHGLEPDLRAVESSVICTSVAFQIISSFQSGEETDILIEMRRNALGYLLQVLDRENGHWRIIPASLVDSPRAPWWQENSRGFSFDDFSLNPSAEILGLVYAYGFVNDADLLDRITRQVIDTISAADEMEMHDLYCCLRLLIAPNLPQSVVSQLQDLLAAHVKKAVITDPAKWSEYGLRPLDVVESPESPFMAGLEEAIAANLDYVISEQTAEGAWMPTWTWGDAFPDAWRTAQVEWAGIITLGKLRTLQKFGRIVA